MRQPKTASVIVKDLPLRSTARIYMLGQTSALSWAPHGEDVEIRLPASLPGRYAYVLKVNNRKP